MSLYLGEIRMYVYLHLINTAAKNICLTQGV